MTAPSSTELPLGMAESPDSPARLAPQMGRTGLKHWSGYISEEFLIELRGERGVRVFDEMRKNEPVVAGALLAINMIIRGVDWIATPASQSGEDLAAAALLEKALEEIKLRETVENICTMFPFGWALFEEVYKLKDGKILWDKFAFRGQDSLYRWEFDDQGRTTAFIQRPAPDYREIRIPMEKCILFRTSTEKDNPEGLSILRAAYKPYFYKRTIEEIEAMGAERDLLGIPVMEVPWGATQAEIDEATLIVENIKNDDQAGLVLTALGPEPEKRFNFKLVSGQGSSGKVSYTDRLIQRYSSEMLMTVLAQFIRLGQTGGGGSYNLSSDQRDLFQVAVRGWMAIIRDTLNDGPVKKLLELNGMKGKAKLDHGRIGQLNLQTFTNFLVSGVQNKFLTITRQDEEWLRAEAEMPELPDGVKTAGEQSKEDAAAMKQQMAGGGAPPAAGEGGPDNSGLNKNPGANQKGVFGPETTGASVPGAGDVKTPVPLGASITASEFDEEEEARAWRAFEERLPANLLIEV